MHNQPDNELPDDENELPLDAGDAPRFPFFDSGTWGSVDANGERRIRGRLLSYSPDADMQGDIFPPEGAEALFARWKRQYRAVVDPRLQAEMDRSAQVNADISRWTKDYFSHSAVPAGLLSTPGWKLRRLTCLWMVNLFLLGVLLGLIIAAELDARLPK